MLRLIAFDADDTLWHNETHYVQATARLKALLSSYQSPEMVEQKLNETEYRNVPRYGFGIKSFTLSMVETAIGISNGSVSGREIKEIIELGQEMLRAPVSLFDHAVETLAELAVNHELVLITKGDLLEQENKVERSGLEGYFCAIEILREKNAASYQKVLDRYGIPAQQFLMVGNSLKSDILPVLEIGALAVHIPYQHTWVYEHPPESKSRLPTYHELENLSQLPELITMLDGKNEN
jgi:putative hydrolase of the HAD superfamily